MREGDELRLSEHAAAALALFLRTASLLLLRIAHLDVVLDAKLVRLLLERLHVRGQLRDHILNLSRRRARKRKGRTREARTRAKRTERR